MPRAAFGPIGALAQKSGDLQSIEDLFSPFGVEGLTQGVSTNVLQANHRQLSGTDPPEHSPGIRMLLA
jgi:hypothetical protein